MRNISAIIPAAGFGLRLKKKIPKALIELKGKPIFVHTLNNLTPHPDIKDIILVVPPGYIKTFENKIRQYRLKKIKGIIGGGLTRRQSVEKGLSLLTPRTEWVLIHDAVRPFINQDIIWACLNAAKKYGAAIVGVPLKATIKKVVRCPLSVVRSFIVGKTVDRNNLWEIQTPQVFKKDLILKAYNKFKDENFTDDASLVEKLGAKIKVVLGSYFNIKITTPEDLVLAEAILGAQRRIR